MRALLVATLVFVAALAGCSGKKPSGEEELSYKCPDGSEVQAGDYEGVLNETASDDDVLDFLKTKCPKGTGTSTKTATNSTPNQLPVLALNITDFGGNVTNVTMLDGNLTFDATGSFDPDGQVSAIAISVQDSNTTRTKSLYDLASKKFSPATFSFDRPGIVNVSIAMVDDRAGFTNTLLQVYVNHPQEISGGTLTAPVSQDSMLTDPCTGAQAASDATDGQIGSTIIDAQYFKAQGFSLMAGASFVEAIPGEDTLVTICAPDGTAISPEKSDEPITTNPDVVLAPPTTTQGYEVGFYTNSAQAEVSALVIVHYEPRAAAAPEA